MDAAIFSQERMQYLEPEEIVENAAAVGAYSFLPKPFSKQKLLELVAEALASKSAPSQGEDGH